MVTIKDIVKAINLKIKDKFPDIPIQSTDIKEGFKRPSFYVNKDDNKSNRYNQDIKESKTSIRIYYFPTSAYKNRIELLNMENDLTDLFLDGVLVSTDDGEYLMEILEDDIDSVVTDGVLQVHFYLYLLQDFSEEDAEVMEELEMDELENN
ncbi:DUF6838 family protein [Clostridium sp. AWRP]|uniref:phage tail terminator family protein n=1 Tax=Clostridium sp. AWRP TaxID=2212991 RepID=UPI000FD7DA57|nr:hypothetical protein [Clostridium sp. AWRP]AZV56797.1 hypothetical protein DMR38_09405 [Clostridium sp. AWRP]